MNGKDHEIMQEMKVESRKGAEKVGVSEVRAQLAEWADARLADFSGALIPGRRCPILGVRLPKLRGYARQLGRQGGWEEWWESSDVKYHEEVLLRGLVAGYAGADWKRQWYYIRRFVAQIDNWAVCDSVCATCVSVRRHREEVWPFLLECIGQGTEFEQRFAVVMQMDHFLVEAYVGRVLEVWRRLVPRGYYVEMAVAWGLSVAVLKFPELAMSVLEDTTLSLACRRKACRKILESLRTSPELRERVRALQQSFNKK